MHSSREQGRRFLAWWAVVLTVAVIGLSAPRAISSASHGVPKEGYNPHLWGRRQLLPAYTFLKPGATLFTAVSRIVSPEWRAVFLSTNRGTVRLEASRDLVGFVSIRSPQQALAYAQFLTSNWVPVTTSDPGWQEVRIATADDSWMDRFDSDWKQGDRHRRGFGRLRPEEWKANKLTPPAARRVGEVFEVTRWLWTVDPRRGGGVDLACVATDVVWRVTYQITLEGRVTEKVLGKRKLSGVRIVEPIGR